MEILTLVFIFVAIEAGLYGLCCLMCPERHMPNETEEESKMTHHPPPRGVDHQKAWSHATDHQHHKQENNTRLVGFLLKSLR